MSELTDLKAQRESVIAGLKEIEAVSEEGRRRILEAIKSQRWYFFRDNKYILMDKATGLLWANLNYFPYDKTDYDRQIKIFNETSGITGWQIPTGDNMKTLARDKKFPFSQGGNYRIMDKDYWHIDTGKINLDSFNTSSSSDKSGYLIPCNRSLIANSTYEKDVSPGNKVYSETERLQFTLDLFTQNNLRPKFNDDEISELYDRIYVRKPELEAKLQELDSQIAALTAVRVLSSEFDYTAQLAQYDIPAISSSVIKYSHSLKKWTDGLMSMIESYEREKQETISQSSAITLQLSRKYIDSPALSTEENEFLRGRIEFFRQKLSLGMHSVKERILSYRKQAGELEARIDSTDSLTELAAIQAEPRADFPLVAENTARIIMNALLRIEYFESHRDFVANAVKIITEWTENYRVFKTTLTGQLKDSCVNDGLDEKIFSAWLKDWESLRLEIERKLQPVLEWGLNGDIPSGENGGNIPERLITALEDYRKSADKFFLEKRKAVYQEFEDKPAGGLLEKIKCESMLYDCASKFQESLKGIIFECTSPSDRIFILNWAGTLLDIPLDSMINDNDFQEVSAEILDGFMKLKARNYDVYLSDAQSYSDELSRRNEEYNSLASKMRNALKKGELK